MVCFISRQFTEKKRWIHSSAKERSNFKLTNKIETMEMKIECDLFGSILFLSLQGKIDMGEALQFPVPLCLAHNYGLQQKTPESSLLKEKETRVNIGIPILVLL